MKKLFSEIFTFFFANNKNDYLDYAADNEMEYLDLTDINRTVLDVYRGEKESISLY